MDVKSVSQEEAKPEDQPKPPEPTPMPRGRGTWLLWLSIAPVVYVLSIGPAAKIDLALHHHRTNPPNRVFETTYFPVMWCAQHSCPFNHALVWYLFSVWKLGD